jgi:hypothetical protein
MAHPDGGKKPIFQTRHSFAQALEAVGKRIDGMNFLSSTDQRTTARVGDTDSGAHAIAFRQGKHGGNVCQNCWGFTYSCSGTRISQWVRGLDRSLGE